MMRYQNSSNRKIESSALILLRGCCCPVSQKKQLERDEIWKSCWFRKHPFRTISVDGSKHTAHFPKICWKLWKFPLILAETPPPPPHGGLPCATLNPCVTLRLLSPNPTSFPLFCFWLPLISTNSGGYPPPPGPPDFGARDARIEFPDIWRKWAVCSKPPSLAKEILLKEYPCPNFESNGHHNTLMGMEKITRFDPWGHARTQLGFVVQPIRLISLKFVGNSENFH